MLSSDWPEFVVNDPMLGTERQHIFLLPQTLSGTLYFPHCLVGKVEQDMLMVVEAHNSSAEQAEGGGQSFRSS